MSKRYKVIGRSPTLGHKPGEEFEAELPQAKENRLVERGSIEVLSEATPEAPAAETGAEHLTEEEKAAKEAEAKKAEEEAVAKAEAEKKAAEAEARAAANAGSGQRKGR